MSSGVRSVWITGAGRGLGQAIAVRMAAPGSRLGLTARSLQDLADLASELAPSGADCLVLPADVTDSAALRGAAHELAGDRGIDVVVANAGVSPVLAHLDRVAEGDWRHVLDVNLGGAFATVQAALPHLRPGAVVVLVSSVHGARGAAGLAPYSASKAGLEGLTRSLALELAERNIRVAAVAPGYVETDMTAGLRGHEALRERLLDRIPLRRFAHPDEIAGTVQFIASEDASYLTGTVVHADGGWSAA